MAYRDSGRWRVIRTTPSGRNPVSTVTQAVRELFGNTGAGSLLPRSDAWSMQNPVLYTLLWVGIILAIFVPLSIRQYKRAASR